MTDHPPTCNGACGAAAILAAELRSDPRPARCPVHQADLLEADAAQDALAEDRHQAELVATALGRLDEVAAARARRQAQEDRRAHLVELAQTDPMAASLCHVTGAAPSTGDQFAPLGSAPSAYSSLAGMTDVGGRGPFDAA